jgi:Fuc2NAc and GlcNAc transferase
MSLLIPIVLAVAVFLSALWFTGRFLRYAVARQLLDVPNARSSHVAATPRGGGAAIVVATLATLPVLGWTGALAWPEVSGLLGGGVLVALLGFADDRGHIILRRWRLLGHSAAAVWVLAWLGGLPPLPVLGSIRDLGWMGYALAALYLVWLLNLTNFMDGIDGIAAVEAITVSLAGVLLCLVVVPGDRWWLVPLVLASAASGFLVWNWPPAKIFMGDAGSGFLGLTLAVLSLQAGWVFPTLFWSWVILLGVFVVDATVTLLRRIVSRERFYEAHRCHAYQHAARRWGAHLPVTLAVGAINICWLLPMALLVALGMLDGLFGVVIAYAPLVGMAVWLKAGKPSPA